MTQSISSVAWRQALYASSQAEDLKGDGVLVEEPSLPASPVVTRPAGPVTVDKGKAIPVNNGVVRGGLRMMVSRVLGYI